MVLTSDRRWSLMFMVFYVLAFSNLVFGAIPEPFALTKMAIAILIYYHVTQMSEGQAGHR